MNPNLEFCSKENGPQTWLLPTGSHMVEHVESPCLNTKCQYVDIESFETHMILFINRVHFSDRHEDLLEVPIRAHVSFRQRCENLLHCVKMAYFCQSGFRETFLRIVIMCTLSGAVE